VAEVVSAVERVLGGLDRPLATGNGIK
jgi:hypothetical protein